MAKMKMMAMLLGILFLLFGCKEVYRYTEHSFYAMSTIIAVKGEDIDFDGIEKLTAEKEKLFSRTIQDSEISRLNADGKVTCCDETSYLIRMSLDVAQKTDGAFNPCMGSIVSLWDIASGKDYVPADEEISEALECTDYTTLSVDGNELMLSKTGIQVDLGGIAKGYTLGKAVEYAKSKGAVNVCISFGGNVGVIGSSKSRHERGETGWTVGITDPFNNEETLGSLVLHDSFIAVSGAYERYFEKDGKVYHHIFDSQTGKPSCSDVASSCVIAKDAALGDALSTALFVMGSEKALDFYKSNVYNFDMILITNDGKLYVTDGIYDEFTLKDQKKYTVISVQN